jgi:hypothetical protein
MDSAKLNDWMQVVGIFALVASLVFVGLQMKQSHDIALSVAYQSRAATGIDMTSARAANEKGLAAWYANDAASIDDLSAEEVRAGTMLAAGFRIAIDNALYQNENGFVSDEFWAAVREDMKGSMRLLFLRHYFESRRHLMRPSYKAVVDEIIKELDEEERE